MAIIVDSKCNEDPEKLAKSQQIELPRIPQNTTTNENSQIDLNNDLSQKLIKKQQTKSSDLQASINLFKSFIGSGILGLPFAFQKAGYLLSSLSLLVFLVLMIYCSKLLFLIFDDYNKPGMTLGELFERTMGSKATSIYYCFVIMLQVGVCASYIIFFTEFFQIAFNVTNDPNSKYYIFMISLVILIPLIMINNFHFFQSYSKIASIFTICTLLAIMEYACSIIHTTDVTKSEHNLADIANLAGFLGIAVYSFEAVGTMFYVKQSMQNPERFEKMFYTVSIIIYFIMVLFSSLCSIAWSSSLNQIVLLDLQKQRKYFLIFQSIYSVNLMFSYPLQFYPIIDRINHLQIRNKYKYVVRIIITIFVALFALAIPKFSSMLNFTGAFAGNTLQYLFPVYVYHRYFQKTVSWTTTIFNLFLVIFIVVCGVFSIHNTVLELIQ